MRHFEVEISRLLDDAQSFIDTANAPIFGVDASLNVTQWNRKAAAISGYQGAEVMGKPFLSFIGEDLRTSVEEVLTQAMTGVETANYELPLQTKAGERLHLLMNATSRRDATGQVVGVVGIAQDITDVKHREVGPAVPFSSVQFPAVHGVQFPAVPCRSNT